MRILIGLTYYRPHYSGLTIYTERLAVALARRGHEVTVLTSRFNENLAEREVCEGVTVIRPKVALRISKGVIMPSLPLWALKLLDQADVVNLHVPQFDAAFVSLAAKVKSKPVLMTYHCDLTLPSGMIHWIANQVSNVTNHITALTSSAIVTNTRDYAENSPFLKNYLQKVQVVSTPVEIARIDERDRAHFREKYGVKPGDLVIGIAARLATEKGVEYLVEAMPEVLKNFPQARVLHVGQYLDVLGEEKYRARLEPLIERLGSRWKFLGVISPEDLAAFFQESRVTVLPSINPTESFGIVQIESMISGTPVIASDLPGVRYAVQSTGMGLIVPPKDSFHLANGIIEILRNPDKYRGDQESIRQNYSAETIAAEYEKIIKEITGKNG